MSAPLFRIFTLLFVNQVFILFSVMKNFSRILSGIVCAASAFCFAVCVVGCIKEREKGADLGVGDVIPDFEVTMSDGSVVSGEDLRQGVSCIVFFNTSCPDCRAELPEIQRLHDEYALKGVSFALISRSESMDDVADYWAANGLEMPFSAQETRHVYSLFAKSGIPRVYMSEKGGIIRHVFADNPVPAYDELKSALYGLMVL